VSTAPQRAYNSLFPYYVEVCAVTQYQRKGEKPGGWGGHATMFLSGAELEPGAGYPRIRLVAGAREPSDPDSGTGISVNKIFDNVTWVAIPGRHEFFRGGLAAEQTLDEEFYEAAIQRAAAAGWFAGITIKDALARERPATMSVEEFIVRHSIGTDFALSFARTAYSARLPLSRDAMGTVIAYLNHANETARTSGYTWNMYTNNCSHIAHNALAAAGVWDPKAARGPGAINIARDVLSVARALVLSQMSDFSFPANNFVRLYEAGNERPVDNVLEAWRNHDIRRTMNDGWISTGPGALIATYPMHDGGRNRMFAAGRDPFLFSVPMLWDKEEKFRKLTRDPPSTVTDLGANLRHFRDRYGATLESQGSVENDRHFVTGDEDEQDFRRFYGRFYERIALEVKRTDALITEYKRVAG
jgi:hypothetical protein